MQTTENQLFLIAEDMHQASNVIQTHDEALLAFQEKLKDLENNSRWWSAHHWNHSRLLTWLCSAIPKSLEVDTECIVERTPRLGQLMENRQSPRPVIVRFLNYARKQQLLQKFRNQRTLQVEGHTLLLFVDYSAEVSRKRKAFLQICFVLFHHQFKFTLAYPAILHLTSSEGERLTFHSPLEAEQFLQSINLKPLEEIPPARKAPLSLKDQRNTHKEGHKKIKFRSSSLHGRSWTMEGAFCLTLHMFWICLRLTDVLDILPNYIILCYFILVLLIQLEPGPLFLSWSVCCYTYNLLFLAL